MARLPQFFDPVPEPFRAGPIFGWLGTRVADPEAPAELVDLSEFEVDVLLDEADYEGIE